MSWRPGSVDPDSEFSHICSVVCDCSIIFQMHSTWSITSTTMPLSAEAIIGLVSLVVACPPSFLVIWGCVRRMKRRRQADSCETSSPSNSPLLSLSLSLFLLSLSCTEYEICRIDALQTKTLRESPMSVSDHQRFIRIPLCIESSLEEGLLNFGYITRC